MLLTSSKEEYELKRIKELDLEPKLSQRNFKEHPQGLAEVLGQSPRKQVRSNAA
jgi:hypothetical protein